MTLRQGVLRHAVISTLVGLTGLWVGAFALSLVEIGHWSVVPIWITSGMVLIGGLGYALVALEAYFTKDLEAIEREDNGKIF